jgi:hypothetical protein
MVAVARQMWLIDYMLDDCFQLISLAYMTVGKNHEPPAVYVATHFVIINH